MTTIRYRVDGVPQWGMGAFAPVPAVTPTAATAGTQRRFLAQWSPTPGLKMTDYDAGPCWDGGATQGSTANPNGPTAFTRGGAPGAFVPGGPPDATHKMAYWQTPGPYMGPNGKDVHMKIFSDNPVPVPATNFARVVQPAQKQPPWATIISTSWPRPFITWPTWGTSRQA